MVMSTGLGLRLDPALHLPVSSSQKALQRDALPHINGEAAAKRRAALGTGTSTVGERRAGAGARRARPRRASGAACNAGSGAGSADRQAWQ
eukprot:366328-Chlamydomonas_euryale.AAC.12